MQHKTLNKASAMVPMTLGMILATLPVTAYAQDTPWQIRLAVVSMDPSGTAVKVPETGESIAYKSNSAIGLGVDLERRISHRLGIDFGVLSASPGIEVEVGVQPLTVNASGDLNITPIYGGLNVHLTPDSRLDLYLGPFLAYIRYGGVTIAAGPGLVERLTSEDDFGVGGVVGLDIDLGDGRWSLNAAVRYIDTTLEATPSDGDAGTTDIDPTIYSAGVGFRF